MPEVPANPLTLDQITRLAEMRYAPTVEAFVRAILLMPRPPDKWFVDAITFAILQDEGRNIGLRIAPGHVMTIRGVQIVEFQQPT